MKSLHDSLPLPYLPMQARHAKHPIASYLVAVLDIDSLNVVGASAAQEAEKEC